MDLCAVMEEWKSARHENRPTRSRVWFFLFFVLIYFFTIIDVYTYIRRIWNNTAFKICSLPVLTIKDHSSSCTISHHWNENAMKLMSHIFFKYKTLIIKLCGSKIRYFGQIGFGPVHFLNSNIGQDLILVFFLHWLILFRTILYLIILFG